MILARSHPHLKYFVQDRAETLVQAKQVWREKYPEAINKELVTFQRELVCPLPLRISKLTASYFVYRTTYSDELPLGTANHRRIRLLHALNSSRLA